MESLYWEIDGQLNNTNSPTGNGISVVVPEEGGGCYIIPEYEYPGLIKVCKNMICISLIKISTVDKSVMGLPIRLTESLYHACMC